MPLLPSLSQAPIASPDDQTEEQQALVKRITERWTEADKFHKPYSSLWDHLGGLWRSYDRLRHNYTTERARVGESGARGVLLDAERDWGGHLHIPVIFATVETVVPRALSRRPKIIAKPRNRDAINHAPIIQDLLNQQLADIDYELKLLPTAKRGFKYGIGWQKVYWEKITRKVMRYERAALGRTRRNPSGLKAIEAEVVDREGCQTEDCDIYDMRWDPAGKSVDTCDYIFHRTWRGMPYIKRKVESGEWFKLDLEAVAGMGPGESRDSVWAGRREAQGLPKTDDESKNKRHEVWEFYEGDRVVTVLDRKLLVANDVTPFHHRKFPFQVFRPTLVEGELVGMGEIEPLLDLSAELSTLRTQRRDAATISLAPPIFYQKGMLRQKDAKTGPGIWTPVQGDPREVIFQPPLRDLPASSYKEEEQIKQDLDLVSGISDAVAGGQGQGAAAETATGIEFQAAAANVRIEAKAKMLRLETILPGARLKLELNRQHLLEGTTVRVDEPEATEVEPGKSYAFMDVTREALDADVELFVEDGSTEPDNPVQRMNNALSLYQATQAEPVVKRETALKYLLEEAGVRDVDKWLVEQNAVTPEAISQTLVAALSTFMPEEQAQELTMQIVEQARELQEEGGQPGEEGEPGAEEPQAMNGAAPPEGAPATNGAAPAPVPEATPPADLTPITEGMAAIAQSMAEKPAVPPELQEALLALAEKTGPKVQRVLRDENGRITGVEEVMIGTEGD